MIFEKDGQTKEMKVYLPMMDYTGYSLTVFITEDGSTYWQRNDALGISNSNLEDAIDNGHLARAAP